MPKGQIPGNLAPRHPACQPASPAMIMPLSTGGAVLPTFDRATHRSTAGPRLPDQRGRGQSSRFIVPLAAPAGAV